ncbi:hypothetical protein G6F63_015784 [Rhizopus arrhizus]|nr:hypothetical protein G6F68_019322 [Rhizopus microsporus]KAG1317159.1 hypothetical protein G6F63_015784 [Rhizopus arrhizus]
MRSAAQQLVRRHAAQLGQAAVDGLAHQAAINAVDRVDQHAVAGLPVPHVGAGLHDLAGHVQADDHGEGHSTRTRARE